MDQYLERIAKSLEIIAAALTEIAGPGRVNLPASTDAPPSVEGEDLLSMPGSAPVPARKPRAAKAAAPAAPAPAAPAPQVPGAIAAAAADKPILLADVAEVVRKVVSADPKNGHANAAGVLQKYGAKRISEVKAEDFPKVVADMQAILNAKK